MELENLTFLEGIDLITTIEDASFAINSSNTSHIDNYYYYETEQLATLGFLLVSIVLGNISVLLALLFTKRRKSRVNFFIQHLALADLSVGLVNVLTDLVWKITLEWNADNKTCKLVRYSQGVVTYSSTYVLVALTIDRYDAIRHPMNFSRGHRKARYLIIIAWVLSCVFSAPLLYLFELKLVQERYQCWIELPEAWHWQLYMSLVSITLFFLPALIIAACYSIIVYTIWSKSSTMTIKHKFNNNWNSGANADTDTKRISSRGVIPKAKVKTVKMTLVIVFVFIACWSPYMVYNLLQVFGVLHKTQTSIAIATFIQSLAPLNSAVNPIIYWCFSTYLCRDLRSKPQWIESRTGRSIRVTDSTTMSMSLSSARLRTFQLQPVTPTQKKLIFKTGKNPTYPAGASLSAGVYDVKMKGCTSLLLMQLSGMAFAADNYSPNPPLILVCLRCLLILEKPLRLSPAPDSSNSPPNLSSFTMEPLVQFRPTRQPVRTPIRTPPPPPLQLLASTLLTFSEANELAGPPELHPVPPRPPPRPSVSHSVTSIIPDAVDLSLPPRPSLITFSDLKEYLYG